MSSPPTLARSQKTNAVYVVWTGISLLLLGHLVASFFPGIAIWGIDYWDGLPVPWRLLLVFVAGAASFPPVARRWADTVVRIVSRRRFAWALTIGLGVAAVVFRSAGLCYGDGYTIASLAQGESLPQIFGNLYTQPLDIIVHWIVHRFAVRPLGGTVHLSYALVGGVSAILGVMAITRMAGYFVTTASGRIFIIFSALSSGIVYLWFGHVESYTLALTGGLWVLCFITDPHGNCRSLAAAWACWIVSMLLHALSIVWLPALLLRTFTPIGRGTTAGDRVLRPGWLTAALFVAIGTVTVVASSFDIHILVPLWASAVNGYAAFSMAHLADTMNLLIFAAPVAPIAILVMVTHRDSRKGADDPLRLLGVATGSALVFAFWIDPTIGAFRDWDLLGVFGIPLSIVAGTVIVRRLGDRGISAAAVGITLSALVHVGSWVAVNQAQDMMLDRVDRHLREDFHYSEAYDRGARRAPWAQILTNTHGRHIAACEHMSLRAEWAPEDAINWANLGIAYQRRSILDSAGQCYLRAFEADRTNALYLLAYGQICASLDQMGNAQTALRRVIELAPELYEARILLGVVYQSTNRLDDAKQELAAARAIDPLRPDADSILSIIRQQEATN